MQKQKRLTLRHTTWTRATYGAAVVAARMRKVAARIDRLDRRAATKNQESIHDNA